MKDVQNINRFIVQSFHQPRKSSTHEVTAYFCCDSIHSGESSVMTGSSRSLKVEGTIGVPVSTLTGMLLYLKCNLALELDTRCIASVTSAMHPFFTVVQSFTFCRLLKGRGI